MGRRRRRTMSMGIVKQVGSQITEALQVTKPRIGRTARPNTVVNTFVPFLLLTYFAEASCQTAPG